MPDDHKQPDLSADDAGLVERLRRRHGQYVCCTELDAASRIEALSTQLAAAKADAERLAEALREAREALHFHYVEWDGEPEDAVPLQLARAKCDKVLAAYRENRNV